ncbi:hypothetical protein [Aliamphritea spongicola]
MRPILDFMQTMPAFVYLIPVIAFFGTGKPPGIIATIIFGMPPVVRLTALGMQGCRIPSGKRPPPSVPANGSCCSKWIFRWPCHPSWRALTKPF